MSIRTASLASIALVLAAGLALSPSAVAQDELVRGPYLQSVTSSSVVVRWRTATPTDSRVQVGPAPDNLVLTLDDASLVTEHEIIVSGLPAGIRLYYSVGTTTEVLAGEDADHSFVTDPGAAGIDPLRIWVVGDSGTAHQQQTDPLAGEVRDAQGVRNAYLRYGGTGAALVSAGATWRYLDDGSDQGAAWHDPAFDDSTWASGPGELGYGDGDETTTVNCGPSAPACDSGNFITTYFRHEFSVADASAYRSLTLSLLRDDGAIAYLNGTEVARWNLPSGAVGALTPAESSVGGDAEHIFHRVPVDPTLLVDGTNLLAVEVHQIGGGSTDISLHAELFAQTGAGLPASLWLMAGDNAYNNGTDDEWQRAAFDPYATVLRNAPLWPVLGNHDIATLDGAPQLDAMTLPVAAEAGGVPSGTEEYYSFDYANVHFVALDSTHSASRQPGSAMLVWLAADLAATTRDWTVAMWHHPPYSKGSHNSDAEIELIEMRENVLPILEAAGVDLVIAGHSHSYERSMLIDGFYATPTLPGDGTVVDAGSGEALGDGAYAKSTPGPAANEGTVYSLVGSSGRNNPDAGALDHPVMFYSVHDLGSLVLDVDGTRLDGIFINRDCAAMHDPACVLDRFTLLKGPALQGYLRLSTERTQPAPDGALPFRIRVENISGAAQNYTLGLVALPPGAPNQLLFAQPLALADQGEFVVTPSLDLSAGVPSGEWTLVGVLLDDMGTAIDFSLIEFEVP